ncbi:MAG: DUF2283 domain-containing protein [Deltaproteobacteria bacterium]|nr:DUF2283 domain-containing protein [Deltaproteobacteria bacterium]
MTLRYDSEADALYLRLRDDLVWARTIELSENVALDVSHDDQLIGIEVLAASATVGNGQLPSLLVENLPEDLVKVVQAAA